MHHRLKQLVAAWFVLQILMPFTAPLQTLDIRDLFGGKTHTAAPVSPESTTTPTMSEASMMSSVVSLITPAALHAPASALVVHDTTSRGPLASALDLAPAPHAQRSVLRL